MNEIIDAIRAAIEPGATTEARGAGAAACRAVLAVLEPAPPTLPSPERVPPEAVQQLIGVLRTMDMDQLLDTAIAKLRSLDAHRPPQATAHQAPRPLSIPLVPLPRPGK